ncbi:MAG TPA: GlsB/YeaQ/YmgE family stress response membrane protein [Verrucomicrobiae bacterium]|nr:GlsB/YeaQ/YmgE family stress response membrane protein [Verrucomicrobiae bacterium]
MTILWTIIIGLLVGLVAKMLMPGRDPGGFIITALLGIAGAFVAHMIGRSMGWYTEGQPAGFLASVVGAIVLLAVYRMATGRRRAIDRV